MRWAGLLMGGMLFGAVALAAAQGRLAEGLRASGKAALAVGPIFLVAIFVMGFTEAVLPQGWVERWLSDAAGWRGLGVAWLAGVLTPGGSVIGMPLAAGMLGGGASPAVVVTYLTSMATLNVVRIPMEVGFYGARVTALRVGACLIVPFVAGGAARLIAALLAAASTGWRSP